MEIVITGIGAISALGNNVEELWDSIINCKSGIQDLKGKNIFDGKIKAGQIDYTNINYSALKSKEFDNSIKIALHAINESLECANLEIEENDDNTGIVIGTSLGGNESFLNWINNIKNRNISLEKKLPLESLWDNVSKFIARFYKINGPNITMVTACSASANALAYGYNLIESGRCKRVICGGFDLLSPTSFFGFHSLRSLTNDICRPFDRDRDGISLGEAAAFLILEEKQSAISRGVTEMIQFAGYGIANDGHHATSPDPTGQTAQYVMEQAIRKSNRDLFDVNYINAHGTGTILNDKMETLAVKRAFKQQAYNISISSTKSMHGHTLGAAGALEAIITILSIKNNIAPPTISFRNKDDNCDLFYVPNKPLEMNIEFALSNSFAFGGHSVSLAFSKI